MIEVKKIHKKYGDKKVIDDVSFTINTKEVIGFLGPNGAGKSTIMNIISGYIESDKGEVLLNGKNLDSDKILRKKIGYLSEIPPLYLDMKVVEYLNFVFDLKKISLKEDAGKFCNKKYIEEIMEKLDIDKLKDKLIKNISRGYKQKVGLAQAIIGNPEFLILDEPTVGLDPNQIINTRNVLKELSKNHSIVLSSHILPEISKICTKIIIINKGKILVEDTPENVSNNILTEKNFMIQVKGFRNDILNALWKVPLMTCVKINNKIEENVYEVLLETKPEAKIDEELKICLKNVSAELLLMKELENSLEDVFIKYIKKDNGELPLREEYKMDFGNDLKEEK